MPEIWLKYGSTDVVLDIRFENLASEVSSTNSQVLADEQIKAEFEAVPVTDNTLLIALSSSKQAARAINAISYNVRAKGFSNATVDVPAKLAGALRTNLADLEPNSPKTEAQPISINRIEYQSIAERMAKFHSTVVVSQMSYDPLFGFAGAPTGFLRNMYAEKMAEAFAARQGNLPVPGVEAGPLKVALGAVEDLQVTSIELVAAAAAGGTGIAGVYTGTIGESFSKALAQFKAISEVQVDSVRSAIVSASNEAGPHSTLAGSLNSLWNSVHAVKEGGTAVLLAECREGLGGGALQAYMEGRLAQEQIAGGGAGIGRQYTDGLEHLLYIQELKQKKELGLVSTLPHYYATRLGFSTFNGVREALEKLLAKHGKGHKVLVVADADIIRTKTVG